jgi:hypothetical protein
MKRSFHILKNKKNWSSFQVERDQLARKVIELEDQIDKLESDNLSQKTRLATYEREAKRPVQEYADFQNLNQKLQVRNGCKRSIKVGTVDIHLTDVRLANIHLKL